MNTVLYVKTDIRKLVTNRFILANQLNKDTHQEVEMASKFKTGKDNRVFTRVYSTPDKIHEDVSNFLTNRRLK